MAGITRVKKNKVPENVRKWARKMVAEIASSSRFSTYQVSDYKNVIVCIDFKTGKSSVARCSPKDEFDLNVGKAIAYARCKGYAIPRWVTYKAIGEMKNGERFKYEGKIYTFIGYFKDWDDYSDIKVYATSYNGDNLKSFASFPYEEYEMVE